MEKAEQDDALSDLSNILGDLKGMAVDMGSELDRLVALYQILTNAHTHTQCLSRYSNNFYKCRQNKSLDHLDADVDELNSRVKGANQRARHLLGK